MSTDTRGRDILRQSLVISAFVFMIIGDAVGLGAFGGTPIQDAQGGSFSPDASYLTPSTAAFGIWTPIYLGLALYTVWQALPGQRASDRQRAVGYPIAVTMVLNGLWLVTVQFLNEWATVVVIVLLLLALLVAYLRAIHTRRREFGPVDAALIDGVTGLHLGWVTLATVANVSAALTASAPQSWEAAASVVGVIVLIVVGIIGLGLSARFEWRLAAVVAISWGLFWLGVERLTGDLRDVPIGVTAFIVAAVVLLVPAVLRTLRLRAAR